MQHLHYSAMVRKLTGDAKVCRWLQPVRHSSGLLNGFDQAKHAAMLEQFDGGGSIDLETDESSGIATLLLNNPNKKNALSGKMMVDLYNHINSLERWKTGKGVVLAGMGGTFCSGGDLETIFKLDKNHAEAMCMFMQTITTRLLNLPLVSLAALDGHAIGGGAELATACDFRIMTPRAKIGFVQAKLNLSPGWGGGTRLVKLIDRTNALRLLISGAVIDPNKALEYGMIDEIVTNDGDVLADGRMWLKQNLVGNVDSTRALKTVVAKASDTYTESSLVTERLQLLKVWGTPSHAAARENKQKHK